MLFKFEFVLVASREWKDFNYKPRVIKFASETTMHPEKDDPQAIILPQFSSATVPNVN